MPESISTLNAAIVRSESITATEQEPFLRFYLEPDTTVLLPLQHSIEVLSVSRKEIVPIFFMPAWVTGVYNLRGEILWVIDLGHLMGLTPCYPQTAIGSSLTVIVLNTAPDAIALNNSVLKGASGSISPAKHNQMLGCMVSQLEAIEYCDASQMRSPAMVMPSAVTALPFLRGYWWKSDHEQFAVLDAAAIGAAMPKPEL